MRNTGRQKIQSIKKWLKVSISISCELLLSCPFILISRFFGRSVFLVGSRLLWIPFCQDVRVYSRWYVFILPVIDFGAKGFNSSFDKSVSLSFTQQMIPTHLLHSIFKALPHKLVLLDTKMNWDQLTYERTLLLSQVHWRIWNQSECCLTWWLLWPFDQMDKIKLFSYKMCLFV